MYASVCSLYSNIVLCVCLIDDHSCVELSLIDDKEGTDYINASWIDVSIMSHTIALIPHICILQNFRKTRAYIASQGKKCMFA